jgi:hypothetical protein
MNVAVDYDLKSIKAVIFADNAVMLCLLLPMSFVPAPVWTTIADVTV